MKWLKSKQKETRPLPPIAQKVIVFLNQRLRNWADLLQQRTNRLSGMRLKWMLAFFCVLYIVGSVYAILTSLHPKDGKSFTVIPIHVLPLIKENVRQPVLSQKELTRIHQFKLHLDSLNNTADGKVLRDSFLSNRPHFLDTLQYLENLYQQNKN